MGYMKPEDWQNYIDTMNAWQDDAFQQPVTWDRYLVTRDLDGEGTNNRFLPTPLKGLIQYNYFRSWPITKIKDSGEIDKESLLLFLNIQYLKDNQWANTEGQFLFNPAYDRFIINGVKYKAMGEAQAAQASNAPLFVFMVLKREELNTSETKYE